MGSLVLTLIAAGVGAWYCAFWPEKSLEKTETTNGQDPNPDLAKKAKFNQIKSNIDCIGVRSKPWE